MGASASAAAPKSRSGSERPPDRARAIRPAVGERRAVGRRGLRSCRGGDPAGGRERSGPRGARRSGGAGDAARAVRRVSRRGVRRLAHDQPRHRLRHPAPQRTRPGDLPQPGPAPHAPHRRRRDPGLSQLSLHAGSEPRRTPRRRRGELRVLPRPRPGVDHDSQRLRHSRGRLPEGGPARDRRPPGEADCGQRVRRHAAVSRPLRAGLDVLRVPHRAQRGTRQSRRALAGR